jgi:hypothetical protein
MDIDRRIVMDDIAIAKRAVLTAKTRAEKSIEKVEEEKERRWKGIRE